MLFDSVNAATATGSAGSGTGQAALDQTKLEEDLNRFLTLLVTQLEHQDPLDPMDATEFTSQLVQFASVEQQIQQNANLEELLTVQRSTQAAAMVGYLGTMAEVDGNALPLADGQALASYTLKENAAETVIAVRDAAGRVVFSAKGETNAGRHALAWDGTDGSGQPVPNGLYTLDVSALKANGDFVEVSQTAYGRVTGGAVEDGTVTLHLGDLAVPMDQVRSVRETPAAAPATED